MTATLPTARMVLAIDPGPTESAMPTQWELQQIADDLAVVERAFIALLGPPVIIALPKPRKMRLPSLPRCAAFSKQKDAPCNMPATRNFGLCANHFFYRYGHRFRWNWNYPVYEPCKCGRRKDGEGTSREVCPLRVLPQ